MKIAISSEGETLKSNIDPRFGRARGFVIYNLENDDFVYIDNEQNLAAAQGAGIQTAQNIVDNNVDAIITGYCGPKAYKVLEEAEVKIFITEKDTVENVVKKFKKNELQEQQKDF